MRVTYDPAEREVDHRPSAPRSAATLRRSCACSNTTTAACAPSPSACSATPASWTTRSQDASIKAYQSLRGFRGESEVGTWLYRITYTTCLDYLRRERRFQLLTCDDVAGRPAATTTPATSSRAGSTWRTRWTALPVEQRVLIVLVHQYGYDYRAAAEVVGVPEGTVSSRLAAAARAPAAAALASRPTAGADVVSGWRTATGTTSWAASCASRRCRRTRRTTSSASASGCARRAGSGGRPPAPPARGRARRVPGRRRRRPIAPLAAGAAVAAALVAAVAVTWSGVPGHPALHTGLRPPPTRCCIACSTRSPIWAASAATSWSTAPRAAGRSPTGRLVHVHLRRRLPHRAAQRQDVDYTYDAEKRVAHRSRVPRRQGPVLRGRPRPARSRARSSARGWASRRCSTAASPPTPAPSSPNSTPTCPSRPVTYEGRTAWSHRRGRAPGRRRQRRHGAHRGRRRSPGTPSLSSTGRATAT